MSLIMLRIEVSSPPGVSICRTTSWAPWRAARSSERDTYSALAGPIAPAMRSTNTGGTVALSAARTGATIAVSARAHSHQTTLRFTKFTFFPSDGTLCTTAFRSVARPCSFEPVAPYSCRALGLHRPWSARRHVGTASDRQPHPAHRNRSSPGAAIRRRADWSRDACRPAGHLTRVDEARQWSDATLASSALRRSPCDRAYGSTRTSLSAEWMTCWAILPVSELVCAFTLSRLVGRCADLHRVRPRNAVPDR